jgi:glycosyltransferase involved in cell wall biosynthesis
MKLSYHALMASILAFESFDGGSHKQFRETITKHSTHEWTWITRPPRSWKWRMAISALEMVEDAKQQGSFSTPPDCIFTTSLTDTAALRAALPIGCRDIPIVLYMHENQIAYPTNDERDASFAFTNIQSVLTADLTLFNSKWNLDSFIEGIEGLLSNSWDTKLKDIASRIRACSTVAWVPVELSPEDLRVLHNSNNDGRDDPTTIVWPHRWEHDKGPQRLLEIAREYSESLDLRWIILGEQFKEIPLALEQFREKFSGRIEHMGYVKSKEEYWEWLHKADWVLSTADHEFFGIAVVEALFAGCLPWLPERLSYRELLPAVGRGLTPETTHQRESIHHAILEHLHMAQAEPATARIDTLISSIL